MTKPRRPYICNGKAASDVSRLQRLLSSLDYPLTKQTLLRVALESGADEGIMNTLRQIADREYFSPTAISYEVKKLEC
ncbi:MAG TPA: DUF2795 domain-containing protein [Burkholderiales bacterium]|nr:DUF2795 domain-containing protein [Burkholderiales bacterium]